MPNEPRLQSRDIVFSSQETTQRTLQEASPRSITISAMTANTLTSTQLTANHVGCIVAAEDGALRGNPARILAVAAGVATLDRSFHTTLAAGAVFRVWIPAVVPWVADSGSTTSFVDATHSGLTNEPDGTFTGDFALMRTGANAGGAYKINGSTASSGTLDLTGDPTGTGVAAGDLCDVVTLARPEPGSINSTVDTKVIERRIQGYGDADQGVVTNSPGSIEMKFPLKPLSAAAGSTVQAVAPYELGRYLRDVMTETKDTGTTYTSQSGSAPNIQVTVGSGTGLSVGGFVLMSNGEASQIIDKPSANVVTLPQLTTAAQVAASTVYGSCWYKRKTSDFRTRTWFHYLGGLDLRMLMGTAPTIELDLARDAVINFVMKYSATDAIEYSGTGNPNALANHKFSLAVDTTVPVDGKGARIMIDGVKLLMGSVKINFGIKTLLRMSLSGMNQGDGFAFDTEPVTWTVDGYLADNNDTASFQKLTDRLRTGNVLSLFYQKGTNPMETFCAAAPYAEIMKVSGKPSNGQWDFSFDAQAILPQAARGSTANAALAAFAIGYV